GRLSHQKNPVYALKIIRELETSTLTILGEGDLLPDIQRYIEDNQMKSRINIVGFVPNANDYYEHYDAILLTSLYEGFPYVVLEAMSKGCLVIGTDVPGLKGVVRQTNNIVIPLNNEKKAAEIIKEQLDKKLESDIGNHNI